MENLKKLKIVILGKTYNITTDEKESDVYDVAEKVDSLMKLIAEKAQLQDYSQVAVLAALEFASDLKKSKNQLDLWQKRASSLDSLLSGQIEKR